MILFNLEGIGLKEAFGALASQEPPNLGNALAENRRTAAAPLGVAEDRQHHILKMVHVHTLEHTALLTGVVDNAPPFHPGIPGIIGMYDVCHPQTGTLIVAYEIIADALPIMLMPLEVLTDLLAVPGIDYFYL